MAGNDNWDGVDRRKAEDHLRNLTADIVAAHVSHNSVSVTDLPQLIGNVWTALSGLSGRSNKSRFRKSLFGKA